MRNPTAIRLGYWNPKTFKNMILEEFGSAEKVIAWLEEQSKHSKVYGHLTDAEANAIARRVNYYLIKRQRGKWIWARMDETGNIIGDPFQTDTKKEAVKWSRRDRQELGLSHDIPLDTEASQNFLNIDPLE